MRAVLMSMLALVVSLPAAAQDVADTIYSGGPILTMEDAAPRADSVAVRDGRILAVGDLDAVMMHRGDATVMINLDGRAMLPGFVDAHGHVMGIGLQALSANMLPAPDGLVNDIPSLQSVLRDYAAVHQDRIDAVGVMIGFGYDDSQLDELRHPTRHDLDAVSTEVPILVVHQSGHLGALNSAGLAAVGFTAETEDPAGGVIRREDGSQEPNGVLEETPLFIALTTLLKDLDEDGSKAMFRAGAELSASFGYTTAQDGRSTTGFSQLMAQVADQDGGLLIDIVSYPDVLVDRDFIARTASRDYRNGFRVAGAKLTIDGSPQGFTAWRDRPYYKPPENFRGDYVGYPAASPDQVFDAIDWAFQHDIQIQTHANGEAASDLLIAALTEAESTHGKDDRRPVLIHGQFQREDQVDRFVELDVFPSLFPMHTFYWGDWHRDRTVGPVNAENISPTGWYMARGSMFSSHHDAPVAFPDSMRILDATVTRRSRSGDILGPQHRVDVMTALKAMTLWPAYQHFEEDHKGSLAPGKVADFVVLSQDPTTVDPETLESLKVTMTVKADKVIYTAGGIREGHLRYRPPASGGDPLARVLRAAAIHSETPPNLTALQRRLVQAQSAFLHGNACVGRYITGVLTPAALPLEAKL